jgi:hypothetical protein
MHLSEVTLLSYPQFNLEGRPRIRRVWYENAGRSARVNTLSSTCSCVHSIQFLRHLTYLPFYFRARLKHSNFVLNMVHVRVSNIKKKSSKSSTKHGACLSSGLLIIRTPVASKRAFRGLLVIVLPGRWMHACAASHRHRRLEWNA